MLKVLRSFLSSADFLLSEINFLKKFLQEYTTVSKRLDQDQAQGFVNPNLGPKGFQRFKLFFLF